jgi:hypothetical protein
MLMVVVLVLVGLGKEKLGGIADHLFDVIPVGEDGPIDLLLQVEVIGRFEEQLGGDNLPEGADIVGEEIDILFSEKGCGEEEDSYVLVVGHGLVWFWLVFRVLPANKRKLVCFPGYHKEKQTSFSLFSAGLNNPYFYRV